MLLPVSMLLTRTIYKVFKISEKIKNVTLYFSSLRFHIDHEWQKKYLLQTPKWIEYTYEDPK